MPVDNENATLVSKRLFNPELGVFTVRLNNKPRPEFKPGQYATLGLPGPATADGKPPKLVRRMYSVASPNHLSDVVEFYIVKVEGGAFTPSLFALEEGDKLFMAERLGGHFTLDPVPDGKNLVMVGTGTGLAPFRSMLLTYRQTGRWNKFVLIEGCRYVRDLGYMHEMMELARHDESFVYLPSVTREDAGTAFDGYRGRIHGLLEPKTFEERAGFALDPQTCHVFLCGNPAMIDDVEADLTQRGFVVKNPKQPAGNLHYERYW